MGYALSTAMAYASMEGINRVLLLDVLTKIFGESSNEIIVLCLIIIMVNYLKIIFGIHYVNV